MGMSSEIVQFSGTVVRTLRHSIPLLGGGLILPLLPRASLGSTQDFQPRSKCDVGKSVQL